MRGSIRPIGTDARSPLDLPRGGYPTGRGADSFAARLDASFRARAARAGVELPSASTAGPAAVAPTDTADALWRRAQELSAAAGNGPGDEMLRALGEAADARAERRHRGGGIADLFDI